MKIGDYFSGIERSLRRVKGAELDGVEVNLIDLENLKKNKKASGRPKDMADFKKLS